MKNNKVLVIGSGGRCHAIVDALSHSPRVDKIYCAPGNAGISSQAQCVPIKVEDIEALADFAEAENIDLTVVGPEASLAAGVADEFAARGLRVLGPTKSAARIESSKEFAKKLMEKYGIPTGHYRSFTDFEEALEFVKSRPLPAVIKYDGLAAGKGVVVASTYKEAEAALRSMLLDGQFGHDRVIVEEFLEGPEFSLMCLVNGNMIYPLATAQDHKRAFDGDRGPNTGGMGAYSPVAFVTEEVRRRALDEIMQKAADAMVAEGVPFTGILYGGLILTDDGPKVIEFNARFGDPETEVVLPRLKSDIYDFFEAVIEQRDFKTAWSEDACLGIVLASEGYPGSYEKGVEIKLPNAHESLIYHMGTAIKDGELVTAGGRVMMTVGLAPTLEEARDIALRDAEAVKCDSLFHRTDIGKAVLGSSLTKVIVSGTEIASDIKKKIKIEVEAIKASMGKVPHLAVILVGNDPASANYVNSKGKACTAVGFEHTSVHLDENTSEEELLKIIEDMNADENINGILVQLPLPEHINKSVVLKAIDPQKDVDAFHPMNVASLWKKEPGILPCTPKGIIRMLDEAGIEIEGAHAVVIGRSNIVGFPVAKMLLDRDATVTIAHSHTKDLADITREADILVVAIGKAKMITADMVKPGAAVIDVGINRDTTTGRMCGDVDFEAMREKVSIITPVPGGVGPMTIACLMENTLECFKLQNQI